MTTLKIAVETAQELSPEHQAEIAEAILRYTEQFRLPVIR